MRSHRFFAPGHSFRTLLVLAFFGAALVTGLAQQPPPPGLPQPRLFTIFPMGAKAGTTVEVVFAGQDIEEPEGLLFSHPAIKAEVAAAPPPPVADPNAKAKGKAVQPIAAIKYKVTIPPEVPPGIHDVRVFNKWGLTNPRAFVVGDQTDSSEIEPNNDVPQAQKVELNTTINGVISTPTDVDYFSFAGKKGQRVIVSCLASSIDSKLHPVIELYEPGGRRMATNRDYFYQDALLDATLPTDGNYLVRVFQFTHTAGTAEYFYRLTISTAPWIDSVFPSVVEPGKQTQVTIYGRNLPGGQPDPSAVLGTSTLEKATVTITAPSDPAAAQRLAYTGYITPPGSGIDGFEHRVRNASGVSNPFLLSFARAPLVLENGTNIKRETAQEVKVPCEVAGRLDKKHPGGWFSFSAKKGEVLTIEVLSERLGSPTDLVMALYNADTKALIVEADDDPEILSPNQFFTRTSDPQRYRFTVPADGKYLLLVKSQDSTQLDPRHRYHLRISPEMPDFRLVLMPTSSFQPEAPVLRAGANQDYIAYVWRQDNFSSDIALTAEGLPPGVSFKAQTISPAAKAGLVVLSAAPDATPWVGEIKIKGTATINGQPVVREARFASITWPNPPQQVNVPTFTRLDRGIPLAVRDKAPFGLTAEAEKAAVLAGEKVNIKLKVARQWADFKAPVQVALAVVGAVPNQPAQNQPITIAPVTIAADKADGTAVVDVKATTPPGNYTLVLRGSGPIQFAKDPKAAKVNAQVTLPATPVVVTVLPKQLANVTLTPPNGTGKIGGQTEVMVKVARMYDYAGEFKVQLVLPPNVKGVVADEVTIPAGKDEAKLVINVTTEAPPGNLQGVLVRAVAIYSGAQVVQEAKLALNIQK
jgi:hypothetical protein